ncbi:MAG TPA: hypothetical protein VK894_00435 [Jiangellales bacterium]|nr:hypothetical protein [Jiangellales bacterium]
MPRSVHRLLAPVAAALGVCSSGVLLGWALARPWQAVRAGSAGFDDLVAVTAGAGAILALGYLALVLAVTALGALPGAVGDACATLADRVTPAALRGLARAAVGLGLAAGSVAAGLPASAAASATPTVAAEASASTQVADLPGVPRPQSPPPADDPAPDTVDLSALGAVGRPTGSAGWSPGASAVRTPAGHARPAAEPSPAPPEVGLVAAAPRGTEPVAGEVVVRRGDTLWDVSARALGPGATTAEIAGEWPRWYDANRDVIGADPDLLLPGTVLRPPGRP